MDRVVPDPNPTNEPPTPDSLDSFFQDIRSTSLPDEPQVDHVVDLSQLTHAREPQVDRMVDRSQLTSTLEPQADRSSLSSDKGRIRSSSAGGSPNRFGSQYNQLSGEGSPTTFVYYDKASYLGSGSKSMDHKQRTHGDARRSIQFDSDDRGTDGRFASANATQGAMNRPQDDQSILPNTMSSANASQGASQFLIPTDLQLVQSSLPCEMLDPSQVYQTDLPCYIGSESSLNAAGSSIQFDGQYNQRIGKRPLSALGSNPSEWNTVVYGPVTTPQRQLANKIILNAASPLMNLNRRQVDQSILPSNISSANVMQGASQFLSPTDSSQVDRSDHPCYMGSESSLNVVGSSIQFDGQYKQRIGKRPLSAFGEDNQAGGMGSESQSRDQRRRVHGAAGSSIQFDSDDNRRRTVSATLGEITPSFPSHDQDAGVGRTVQPTVIQLDGSSLGSRRTAHGAFGDIQLGHLEGTKPGLGTFTSGGSQTPNVPMYNLVPSMPGPSARSQAPFRNDRMSVLLPFGEPLQNPNFGQHAAPPAHGVQAGSKYNGYMAIPGLLPPRTPEDLIVKGLLSNHPPQILGELRCDLCGGDLAFEPTGSTSRYATDPAVEVRRCGHSYHVSCLRRCFKPEFPFPPCYLPCTLCTKKQQSS